jgi:hypothetical protein
MTRSLNSLTIAELAALYNKHAKTPVKGFRDEETALASGATLDELCEATSGSDDQVRVWIDQVRRRGHTVRRTGPKAWRING